MTDIPQLEDDRLSIVVFGPGFGESIAIRVPPGEWLVVDSLTERQGRVPINPCVRLLAQYEAQPKAVLLTHPHADHAAGFDQYVEQWPDAMVGCLPIHLASARDTMGDSDAERALRGSRAEHALSAALDAWERHPAREWRVELGSELLVGDAVVRVVGPDAATVAAATAGKEIDLNELSTPLILEWEGVRVVLGADLPAKGWERVAIAYPDIAAGDHHALKIPHHGSKGAQPRLLAEPTDGRDRRWVGTPWQLGHGTLPRLEDGEGMDLLLSRVDEVVFTALPFVSQSSDRAERLTRKSLNESLERSRFGGDDMVLTYEAPRRKADDAWVMLTYGNGGELVSYAAGIAATTVCRSV